MSPSAEQIENQIKRPLKKGDVLVRKTQPDIHYPLGINFEVIRPNIPSSGRKRILNIPLGEEITIESVLVRPITPHGPLHLESLSFRRSRNTWIGVVRREDRTDLPKE
jgi:hypothetical protein